jgi:hypothetical protein
MEHNFWKNLSVNKSKKPSQNVDRKKPLLQNQQVNENRVVKQLLTTD